MMKSNKTAGKGRWTISVPLFLFVLIYTMQTSQQVRASSIMDEFALFLSKDQDSDGNDFELSAELLSDGVDRSIKMESSHGRRNTQEGDDIRRRRSDDEGDDGDDRSGAGEVEDRFIRNPQNDNFKSPPIVIPDMDDWWSHPNKGPNYFKSMPTRPPIRSQRPSPRPTRRPTNRPTRRPSRRPRTQRPTNRPTRGQPTNLPTGVPVDLPTRTPTQRPTRIRPTPAPTNRPTRVRPTNAPTFTPTRILPTNTPTNRPTLNPTNPPSPANLICNPPITPAQREAALLAELQTISTLESLITPGTPQNDAFNWLVNIDGAQVCPEQELDVTQRYVMALLYFSTSGDGWLECNALISPTVAPCSSVRYLDETSVCNWFNITCGGGDRIIEIVNENNNLLGSVPSEMNALFRLQRIDLAENLLIDSLPGSLGTLNALEFLYLNSNFLSGIVPAELFDASSLTELFLSTNLLTGTFPDAVANMPSLDVIEIENNFLQGNLPVDLPDSLRFFVANNNTLTGQIPTGLADNTNLQALAVSFNQLTGQIPDFIGSLTELRSIDLTGNDMTGPIPIALASLTNLEALLLHFNDFTGTVAPEICALPNIQLITADCDQGGPVTCSCCFCF